LTLPPLLLEWLGALLRAAHVLAGILWIGDSFLFMWMDSSLEQPRADRGRDPKGPEGSNVVGELWMVHSGGFYEVVKRRSLTPAELPPNLYWFKWQSYSTWISGAFLLAVVYWLGGGAMLVDSGSRLTRGAAVLVSAAALVARLARVRRGVPLAAQEAPGAPGDAALARVRRRGVRPDARLRRARGVAPGGRDAGHDHGRGTCGA
jgi:hypothetical protein